MKYLLLIGYDCSKIFKAIDLKSFYLILPKSEPMFPEKQQENLKRIFKNKCIYIDYNSNDLIKVVKSVEPDVLISMGWRRIIPKNVSILVKLCINIHPAILPEYRGYHPLPYIIQDRCKEHGITAHLLENDIDAGDIVLQDKFPISPFATIKTLKSKTESRLPIFFQNLLKIIESGKITFKENNRSKIRIIAKKRTPKDSEIDPRLSLDKLFDKIRSCDSDDYPAFFYREGEKIYIKLWRKKKNEDKDNSYDL